MSVSDTSVSHAPEASAAHTGKASGSHLAIIFTSTIFLSAFLLFGVQPMFTKMVLPWLGGSPAVWSVAMVFFQGLLLLGYLYAHLSTKYLPPKFAVGLHGLLVLAAFATLPLTVSQAFGAPPETGQGFWLLTVFTLSVGLPFFVLSATAPLLQAWFARSGDDRANNPYFLYIASNAGSFAALIAYPLVIEPITALQTQRIGWMWLFAILGLGLTLSGLSALRLAVQVRGNTDAAKDEATSASSGRITWKQRAIWTGLASVPSGLLVAATAHLSTDVGSAPLLWVLPLAVFMLTFIFAFREQMFVSVEGLSKGIVRLIPVVIISIAGLMLPLSLQFIIHIGILFMAALLCHRLLYLKRPASVQLTEFYLWMSFGGMLGGLFAGLLAPLMFNSILEYRLLLVAVLLCIPAAQSAPPLQRQLLFACFCVLVVLLVSFGSPILTAWHPSLTGVLAIAMLVAFLSIVILNWGGQITAAGAAAGAFLALAVLTNTHNSELVVRSFFGVNYVKLDPNKEFRILTHGSTIHGAARLSEMDDKSRQSRPSPTMYYHDNGAINIALQASRQNKGGKLGQVAVLGLGAGALACQAAQGETWSFFEIDAEVVNLARNERHFPFLSRCTPDARVVIGDARLTLQKEQVRFDTLILDAFSSDAVPAHLLTQEAFRIYADLLAPGGMIIAHVSNRYMDLRSVAEAAGKANGLETVSASLGAPDGSEIARKQNAAASTVVAMGREEAVTRSLLGTGQWRKPLPGNDQTLWTDDYANIVGSIIRETMRAK